MFSDSAKATFTVAIVVSIAFVSTAIRLYTPGTNDIDWGLYQTAGTATLNLDAADIGQL